MIKDAITLSICFSKKTRNRQVNYTTKGADRLHYLRFVMSSRRSPIGKSFLRPLQQTTSPFHPHPRPWYPVSSLHARNGKSRVKRQPRLLRGRGYAAGADPRYRQGNRAHGHVERNFQIDLAWRNQPASLAGPHDPSSGSGSRGHEMSVVRVDLCGVQTRRDLMGQNIYVGMLQHAVVITRNASYFNLCPAEVLPAESGAGRSTQKLISSLHQRD